MNRIPLPAACLLIFLVAVARLPAQAPTPPSTESLRLNDRGYFEMTGLNVMLGSDYYPDGHQGGVGIIQNGLRTATNGDLRLEPTPGQWQPMPKTGERHVDPARQEIRVHLQYPDDTKNRKGFNPIDYPDLNLGYTVRVVPAGGSAFRIFVDLDAPLPAAWAGRVGFNLELFPGYLFGRTFALGAQSGIFPRQPGGPGAVDAPSQSYQLAPLAAGGRQLAIAPESEEQRLTIEAVHGGDLQLLDGRAQHTNGWFVVRAAVEAGPTTGALEWLVTPHAIPGWRHTPVVQVSQVGYHPNQAKVAVIELDARDTAAGGATLLRVTPKGYETVLTRPAVAWGDFLRYHYLRFDFSAVTAPGMYAVRYGTTQSLPFAISPDVYKRGVWQPTLETFLPVQMCHMRVNDGYRVWHGLCHADDALMAPVNHNHFDGYLQGPSTLTKFQPGEHVPGLDRGGWHDAGDYDLRIESQADTVLGMALAWELFHPTYDNTTVDQALQVVALRRPDGKPDLLQQIEHGALSIVGGYQSMGRLYRGIQDATLRQYTHLGDAHDMTDNLVFHDRDGTVLPKLAAAAVRGMQAEPALNPLPPLGSVGSADDRWVFTEDNPARELNAAAGLAAASRALHDYNPALAADCLRIAIELWDRTKETEPLARVGLAVELLIATHEPRYAEFLVAQGPRIADKFSRYGWTASRALPFVTNPALRDALTAAARVHRAEITKVADETPYGLPYKPDIWGAGWMIGGFGVQQYFLHAAFPEIYPKDYMLNALNFVLGCHPGTNTSSFVSGVGARSTTIAYGTNRADFSYIPGGITSGTALIRPDFPELLEWPFLWQQMEYCLGRPTSDYLFLVLAADHELNPQ